METGSSRIQARIVTAGPWAVADAVPVIFAGMRGVARMAVPNARAQIPLENTPSTAVITTDVTHLMPDAGAALVGRDAN